MKGVTINPRQNGAATTFFEGIMTNVSIAGRLKLTVASILLLAWTLLLAPAGEAAAKVYLDIDAPTFQKIPVAISDFRRLGEEKLPTDGQLQWFPEEISRLLNITGIFNILQKKPAGENQGRATPDSISFGAWRITGAEYLINGRIQQVGPELIAEFRLYDLIKGELVVGKRYTGRTDDRKIMVQRFASDILASFTGDGSVYDSRIVFVIRRGKNSEIATVNFDGTNFASVTKIPALVLAPKWSHDAKTLAFTSYQDGNPELFFSSLIGSAGTRKIAGFRGINLPGSWSPDGKKLLLTLSIDGNEEIYAMTLDTGQLSRLTNHFAIDVSPSQSPDGQQIAFVSNRGGAPQVYTMNADGGNVRRLTFEGNYNTSPSWSPKGNRIAYEGSVGGRFQIFTIDEDGMNSTQLTSDGNNESPTWSPDGRYISFASKKDGKSRIVVMNANGTNARVLYEGQDNYISPSWSPRLR